MKLKCVRLMSLNITLALYLALGASCATQEQTQDAFTEDSNYFDYEYYGFGAQEQETQTFGAPYDYPYYEEPESFPDDAIPAPVILQEAPEDPQEQESDWFFDEY